MGITGKYDFAGIKKYGAMGLSTALASTPWGAWLVTTPLIKDATQIALEWGVNWLANNGLIVMNIGAIYIEGEIDQKNFDQAIDDAFKKIENQNGKLTPEQIKAIDDEVIKAARKFIVFNRT